MAFPKFEYFVQVFCYIFKFLRSYSDNKYCVLKSAIQDRKSAVNLTLPLSFYVYCLDLLTYNIKMIQHIKKTTIVSATGRKLDRAWNLVVLSNVIFNEDVEKTSFTQFMISNEYNYLAVLAVKLVRCPGVS